jgi:hypothetical protein
MAVIEDEFLQKHYFFNNQILKSLALHAWELADPEDKLKPSFQASDGWCMDFRHRHHYVWRKAHLKRRPSQDAKFQALILDFTETVRQLTKMHEEAGTSYLLANMDETSWKIAYPGIMTWAQKGADDVRINLTYNAKECITAIATITKDPLHYKLPMALIAKGKTARCEKQLGDHPHHDYWVLRSESGWSNTAVMEEYLQRLRVYYDETFSTHQNYEAGVTEIDLIWDCFSAHRNAEIREIAVNYNINLHFVPAGGTGDYQPLDARVFGALKATAKKKWYKRYTDDRACPQDKNSAVEILLESWAEVDDRVINSAWNIFKVDIEEAKEETNMTHRDVLPCYPSIISILSHSSYSSKFHSIPEFDSAKKTEEEDTPEEEDHPWSGSSDDSSESSSSPPSESTDDDAEIQRQIRALIDEKIGESLQLLDPSSFSEATPATAQVLLKEEHERIIHRLDPEILSQDDKIPPYPEVVGIMNFSQNCFFSAALQVLKAIPNVMDYIARPTELPPAIASDSSWVTSAKDFKDFIHFTVNALLDMDEMKNVFCPNSLRSLPYFKTSSSCDQILFDILVTDGPIGITHEGHYRRFIPIPKGKSFNDIIATIDGDRTGNILFFTVSRFTRRSGNQESAFHFHFPLMFKHQNYWDSFTGKDETFLLKAAVCHYPEHYVTYIRRAFTDRFLLINDRSVSEEPIDDQFVHLALYLKCP